LSGKDCEFLVWESDGVFSCLVLGSFFRLGFLSYREKERILGSGLLQRVLSGFLFSMFLSGGLLSIVASRFGRGFLLSFVYTTGNKTTDL
jgi:hypothetical protein